ncbi:FAD/NAD(P)-binding protein [Hymenobacter caeli]|uniref:NAD(P)/FAD-binding protein YdhS n=1 Tax=Hymenobacter caeli TaxID=2735894 RepID=A0ABX2FSX8_9BACT|nr:FAD/NAD(P)-binding protein [Hymenobacter caeli]NRT20062.1 putative NAD(P)/FAD-binding protein YdhS [Hymenobacter caeli]
MTTSRSVITIVGGGFAGTALALHLARQPGLLARAAVHLVEPGPAPGPGLAYAPGPAERLLNVRPGNLSLYPDEPTHFADWLARQPEVAAGVPEFAPRPCYGRYLVQALAAAQDSGGVRWHRAAAVAAPLGPGGRRAVRLDDGTVIESDYVVLALGNFPPPSPAGPDLAYLAHPGYHADPWAPGALASIGPDEPVLLVGAGLTAMDVLVGLHRQGHRAAVVAVARHGRWPAMHGPAGVAYPSYYDELAGLPTVNGVVAVFKRHVRRAAAQGLGWRPVLDALRPDLGRIWSAWPLAEQARFLRHLAPLWGVARHRSPPQNTATVAALAAAGQLRLVAGRVEALAPAGPNLRATVRERAGTAATHLARHVVCCTGPLFDYGRIDAPLVRQLRAAGHLLPDPLGLGIRTDAHGALLAADGAPVSGLFTLGPSRRPAAFESTAVPELRLQAVALAAELAARVAAG